MIKSTMILLTMTIFLTPYLGAEDMPISSEMTVSLKGQEGSTSQLDVWEMETGDVKKYASIDILAAPFKIGKFNIGALKQMENYQFDYGLKGRINDYMTQVSIYGMRFFYDSRRESSQLYGEIGAAVGGFFFHKMSGAGASISPILRFGKNFINKNQAIHFFQFDLQWPTASYVEMAADYTLELSDGSEIEKRRIVGFNMIRWFPEFGVNFGIFF